MTKIFDVFLTPKPGFGAYSVWLRNFWYFKRNWKVSLFWVVIEPLLYFVAIGFGVGALINEVGGVSYLEFFFPAVLANTAMMVPFFEGTYGTFTKYKHQKTFNTILLTPITTDEIVFGELMWAMSKGTLGCLGVIVVSTYFNLLNIEQLPLLLLAIFLTTWMFGAFGIFVSSIARNYDSFIYATSGLVIPMSLFSGTYFPLEQLPAWAQQAALFLPLTHAVGALRSINFGQIDNAIFLNFLLMMIFSFVFMNIANSRFRRKLLG